MPPPLELIARPASQQVRLKLIAHPAPQLMLAPPISAPPVEIALTPSAAQTAACPLGRVRMPLRVLGLALLPLMLLLVFLLAIFALSLDDQLRERWGWPAFNLMLMAFSLVASVICWVVLPRRILRRHDALALTAWRRPVRQDWLWTAAALAAMVVAWAVYWRLVPWIGWDWLLPVSPPEDVEVSVFGAWWQVVVFAGTAVIVAPIVEETFYRGFALGGLNRVWWLIPSILLSAALFSAAHLNLGVLIPFMIFGVILGVVYLRTRHLTAPALAHAGWNLGVTVLLIAEYGVG